jgi:C4-dicarboxylate transporter DctM subunit
MLPAIISVGGAMLNRILNHLEEWLISALIAGATLLIFFAVVHRYGNGLSIDISKWAAARGYDGVAAFFLAIFQWFSAMDVSWAQELCIIMFVWMAKFGAAYGVRTGVHVGVDVAINQLKSPSKYWVILFGLFGGALFTFIIGSFGLRFVLHMYETGQQSNDLEAPMWIVYLAIPCGSFLMCFRFVQVALAFARTGALPHTDESHVEGVEPVEIPPLGTTAPVNPVAAEGAR